MKKKTVVFFMRGAENYGVKTMATSMALGIKKLGYRPLFFLLESQILSPHLKTEGVEEKFLGLKLPSLPLIPSYHRLNSLFRLIHTPDATVQSISVELKKERDIAAIYTHWVDLVAIAGSVGRELGIPVFWEMANSLSTKFGTRFFVIGACRKWRTRVFANSNYSARTLSNKHFSIPVIPIGINEKHYPVISSRERMAARKSYKLQPKDWAIGLFARLVPDKGGELLLKASAMLKDPNLHLIYAGGPCPSSFATKLKSIARQHAFDKQLHFLGHLTNLRKAYAAVDLTANARISPEPFGISVIESLFLEKPVVANSSGGPAETILDRKTGWLVEDPSIDSWFETLKSIQSSKHQFSKMGKAGRLIAGEKYSMNAYSKSVMDSILKEGL